MVEGWGGVTPLKEILCNREQIAILLGWGAVAVEGGVLMSCSKYDLRLCSAEKGEMRFNLAPTVCLVR